MRYVHKIAVFSSLFFFLAVTSETLAAPKKKTLGTATFETQITLKHQQSLAKQCAIGVTEQEDLDASLALCNAALDEDPEDANTYYYRGYNHYYLENYQAAEADFTQAIDLNTSYLAKAYFQRGQAKERQKKLREASKDFKKALELSPDWSTAKRKVESYAWAYDE